jgi:hypothetical protein
MEGAPIEDRVPRMATPTISEPRSISSGVIAERRAEAAAVPAVTYWLAILGIYLLQGALWYYGAEEKIIGGDLKAPAGIEKAFADSFVATFPGTGFAWALISIAEAAIVIALAVSLIRGEFLPSRGKPILLGTLAGSLVVLGALLFGQSMIAAHDSVAQLFSYAAGTIVTMGAVIYLSPAVSTR